MFFPLDQRTPRGFALSNVHREKELLLFPPKKKSKNEKEALSTLKEDFFHPGKPSSQTVGWAFYENAKTRSFIYEWAGDWKDKSNNILTYWLRYTDHIEKYQQSTYILKPNSTELTVVAIYMPEKIAQAKRAEAIKEQKAGTGR